MSTLQTRRILLMNDMPSMHKAFRRILAGRIRTVAPIRARSQRHCANYCR
jgi:hypothetical protein